MPSLTIPSNIKSLDKVFEILKKADIKCSSITKSSISIDASDPANNDVLAKIMEVAEDYSLR